MIDLAQFASDRFNPTDYFAQEGDHPLPLVVENVTGTPKFVIQDGALVPYDPAALGWLKSSLSIVNPPGFTGFPEHDKSDPRYDLAKHADVLGDPADYFVHWEADRPLVVENATGTPKFAFDGDKLVSLVG